MEMCFYFFILGGSAKIKFIPIKTIGFADRKPIPA
jgi:hypothetical protein